MKVIVTAPALVLMPNSVVLRLSDEEAHERKHCTAPLGNGLYKITLENHFKQGQVVEFEGDTIPKQFFNSCQALGADGRPLSAAPGAAPEPHAQPKATDHGHDTASASHGRHHLDGMTKAELLDFAAEHQVPVDHGMNKSQLIAALRKKLKNAA